MLFTWAKTAFVLDLRRLVGVAGCLLALRRLAVGHHGYAHWCRGEVDACTQMKVLETIMAAEVVLTGQGEVVI